MLTYLFCFLLGSALGLFASEFADRWGCSQRYRSPMPKKIFITLLSGTAAAWLYWWEVEMGMLLPPGMSSADIYTGIIGAYSLPSEQSAIMMRQYVFHLVLFTFLLAATLTDFYEMIIPDSITVVGTITAVFLGACFIFSVPLPVTEYSAFLTTPSGAPIVDTVAVCMHVWSPNPMETLVTNTMVGVYLIVALWWFWCFAMLDRVWYTQLPFRKAFAIFCRYLYRSPRTKYCIAAALIVPFLFGFLTGFTGTAFYFLSALTGMAAGMILVWSVRLVAQWVLGAEAMGFGDVTLMGMIGAFLGWQAVLLVFFIAPFFGLVYGIIHAALGRGRAVPYGPFLCLATVVVVIAWSPIWAAMAEYFAFGIGTIGLVLLVLLVLFGGLLHVVHKLMSGLRR